MFPSENLYSILRLRPSVQPNCSSRSLNAARRDLVSESFSLKGLRTPMRHTRWACCACAASGHAAATPITLMKSRRLIAAPHLWTQAWYRLKPAPGKTLTMSALRHYRTYAAHKPMSAYSDQKKRTLNWQLVPPLTGPCLSGYDPPGDGQRRGVRWPWYPGFSA